MLRCEVHQTLRSTAGERTASVNCVEESMSSLDPVNADLILTNGQVVTLDKQGSRAQAAAIKEGRFVAVGDELAVQAYRGAQTQLVDLRGRTVIPGLNDSHL